VYFYAPWLLPRLLEPEGRPQLNATSQPRNRATSHSSPCGSSNEASSHSATTKFISQSLVSYTITTAPLLGLHIHICRRPSDHRRLHNLLHVPWSPDIFKCSSGPESTIGHPSALMSSIKEWVHLVMDPSPLGLAIAIILALSIPIFLHTVVFRASGLTTLPSILLIGPSGSGKTALLTLVS
jgi:hypothetical protein